MINFKKILQPFFLMLLVVGMPSITYSQVADVRNLHVGELWHQDEDIPSGGWECSYAWPGDGYRRISAAEIKSTTATTRMCGLSCGLVNWYDRRKNFFPYAVYTVSGSIIEHVPGNVGGGVNIKFKKILRRKPPTVIVNGKEDPPRHPYDEIDPNLISDAKLEIRWASKIGITFEQDYYAYAAKNADWYFLVDFHALNNGNLDRNEHDRPELNNQDLHGVYFNYSTEPLISYEGSAQNMTIWENRNDDWCEYYGENYLDYLGTGTPLHPNGDPTADSLRVFIVWDGNNNKHEGVDDTGDPDENKGWMEPSPGQGRFMSPQYFGMGILHADKSVDDETNDLSQPATTVWHPADVPMATTKEGYEFFFQGGHIPSPQEMGYTEPNDPVHVARPDPYITIGPYEMPFGSDVHFTMLVAVNGLARDTCIVYGRKWWEWKNGGTGITDAEKDALLATGRDSLFKYFSIATRRYFRNIEIGRNPFDVPDPPPAPDLAVTAGPKSVILDWSDVSKEPDPDTGVLDFEGYRVYRTQGKIDSTYKMIWECGGKSGNPVATHYVDKNVQRGFAYYYYVTAYDDGTQNWEHPGRSLESGKYWNLMQRNSPVYPYLPPDTSKTRNLNKIKVIPNPYNDKSIKYNFPGEPNKIMFINLPPKCTIKIFTVSGDLVKTLEHTDGKSEEPWDQVTDSNQLIFSGVYLYVVQSDIGNKIGKFVIVRTTTTEEREQGWY